MMLSQYFGFQQEPFRTSPDPRCLYLSRTHREALASLEYSYLSNCGFTALIAPPGMGKTTLLFRFLETIRESARSVFLFDLDSHCDPQELVAYILRDIGISPGQSSSAMHDQLTQVLATENRAGRRFVVVIDEAQNLSEAVLERVRLLTNFETSRGKLMQIVLSGQPSLADKLMHASLVQLRQRISTVCRLEALSASESAAYIEHRLKLAGHSGGQLFSRDALDLIWKASQGIPRTINNLCFNALSLCCALKSKQVSGSMVSEVVSDLQLLPAPQEPVAAVSQCAAEVHPEPAPRKRATGIWRIWVPAFTMLLIMSALGILWFTEFPTLRFQRTDGVHSPEEAVIQKTQPMQAAAASAGSAVSEFKPNDSRFQVTVEPNQWLADISVRYLRGYDSKRLHQIQALNPSLTDPDYIEAGQKIWLPGPPPLTGASNPTPPAIARTAP